MINSCWQRKKLVKILPFILNSKLILSYFFYNSFIFCMVKIEYKSRACVPLKLDKILWVDPFGWLRPFNRINLYVIRMS